MASQYISLENQNILWNAIQSSPYFKENIGISKDEWFKNIIHLFYTQLIQSDIKTMLKPALQSLNKKTIMYMVSDLKTKNIERHPPVGGQSPNLGQSREPNLAPEVIVRDNKIRTETLEKQFTSRQQEYTAFLPKPPAGIDFRMVEKDEPITNMESLLQQHMSEREQYLQLQPIIQPDKTDKPNKTDKTDKTTKLSITYPIEDNNVLQYSVIKEDDNIKSKSVSWKDDDYEAFKMEIREELKMFKEEIRAVLRERS